VPVGAARADAGRRPRVSGAFGGRPRAGGSAGFSFGLKNVPIVLPFDLARARASAATFSGFTMGASNPPPVREIPAQHKEWLSFDDSRFINGLSNESTKRLRYQGRLIWRTPLKIDKQRARARNV
jgi:hypothetical protein